MSSRKRNESPDPDARHQPAGDAEAYDLLAAWIRRGHEHRDVQSCWHHDDGTWELVLAHELGRARSVTQRTFASAVRSALGIARAAGAH